MPRGARKFPVRTFQLLIMAGFVLWSWGCARTQHDFKPPAWQKETCRYQVKTVDYGVPAPPVEVSIEPLPEGQMRVTETMYRAAVNVDGKTLLPVKAEIIVVAEDGEYRLTEDFSAPGKLKSVRKGPLSEKHAELDHGVPVFHFHELFLLFRAVELKKGNTIRFHLHSPYAQEAPRARITVEDRETIRRENQDVEAYRLALRFGDYRVKAWVAAQPPHQVLRFTNGVIEMILSECL